MLCIFTIQIKSIGQQKSWRARHERPLIWPLAAETQTTVGQGKAESLVPTCPHIPSISELILVQTCQVCSLEDPPPTPHPATEARMVSKRAVRFMLECFIVFTRVLVISCGFSECIRCFNCRLQQSEQRFKDR